MNDVHELIEKILNADKCGDFFETQDETEIQMAFRISSKMIHPDLCDDPQASEAMEHLIKLYKDALRNIQNGTWEKTGSAYLDKHFILSNVQDISAFELGARYVTPRSVTYIFDGGKKQYYDNFFTMMDRIYFGSKEMDRTYRGKVPSVKVYSPNLSANRSYVSLNKFENEYPMDLFLKAYKNKLGGRDIAWMISRMIDLCCFLLYSDIVLNGFTEENLFINPDKHSIHVYGGWWYATKNLDPMIGTCRKVYSVMDSKTKTIKKSSFLTDIESVRAICRRLVESKTDIPKQILDWINAGSIENTIVEYERWDNALNKAYGPRKFVKFEAKPEDIYTQKRR